VSHLIVILAQNEKLAIEWSVDHDPLMVIHATLTRQCAGLLVKCWAYTVKTWVQILVMAGFPI